MTFARARIAAPPVATALRLLAGGAAALLIAGCAGGGRLEGDREMQGPPYADLLSYPQRLRAISGQSDAFGWQAADVDLRRFDRVLLERIQVRVADDANIRMVDPAVLKSLVDRFHEAIVTALGTAYPAVSAPGPGVVRVRIAVYDLVPPERTVSGAQGAGAPADSAPYLGRAGIATQWIDAQTGQVVAESADNRFGRTYVINASRTTVSALSMGMADYVRAYSTWGYADQAFAAWAAQFRQTLDEPHKR